MKARKASDFVNEMKPPRIRVNKQKIQIPGFVSVCTFLQICSGNKMKHQAHTFKLGCCSTQSLHYAATSCRNFHNTLLQHAIHTFLDGQFLMIQRNLALTKIKPQNCCTISTIPARPIHQRHVYTFPQVCQHSDPAVARQPWSNEQKQMRHCCALSRLSVLVRVFNKHVLWLP